MWQSQFYWQGLNARGEPVSGKLSAPNKKIAKALLQQQGMAVKKIVHRIEWFLPYLRLSQRIAFIRQLAVLLQADLPLHTALHLMAKGNTCPVLQKILTQLHHAIVSGVPLSKAMSMQSRYFSVLTIALIKAGEQVAALPMVLDQLATYQEKMYRLSKDIRKALWYPAIVVISALGITTGLLLFIVPQFEQLFQSFGAQLPWLTRVVLVLASHIKSQGGIGSLLLVAMVFLLWLAAKRFKKIAERLSRFQLCLPILGNLQKQAITARFARTLAMCCQADVPLVDGLALSASVAGHPFYQQIFLNIQKNVANGETLANALQATHQFPLMTTQMLHVGEQAGALSTMLLKIAINDEQQLEQTVSQLSHLLEPAIMLLLGVLVGGLIIAMYLPVFQLGNVV